MVEKERVRTRFMTARAEQVVSLEPGDDDSFTLTFATPSGDTGAVNDLVVRGLSATQLADIAERIRSALADTP